MSMRTTIRRRAFVIALALVVGWVSDGSSQTPQPIDFSTSVSNPQLIRTGLPGRFDFEPFFDFRNNRLYTVDAVLNEVVALDGTTLDEIVRFRLPDGQQPTAAVVDAVTGLVFVANYQSASLAAFHPDTAALVLTVAMPHAAHRVLAIEPETRQLFAASYEHGYITVVDLTSAPGGNLVGQLFAEPGGSGQLTVDSSARRLYQGSWSYPAPNDVFDIDPSSDTYGQVVDHVYTDGFGGAVAIDKAHRRVYTSSAWGGWISPSVAVYDLDDFSPPDSPGPYIDLIGLASVLPTGTVLSVAVNPSTGLVYVRAGDLTDGANSPPFNPDTLMTIDSGARTVVSRRSFDGDIAFPVPDREHPRRVSVGSRNRIFVQRVASLDVYEDFGTNSSSTDAGSDQAPVELAANGVFVRYSDVLTDGVTTATSMDPAQFSGSMAGQFGLDGVFAFEIATTATIAAPITTCFGAPLTDRETFNSLRVLHGEGGALVDRTSSRDFVTATVCATVSSLGPFVIARPIRYRVVPLFDTSKATKQGATAPIKLRLVNPDGTNASAATLALQAIEIVRTSDSAPAAIEDSGNANPDNLFRYNASIGGYIFNLSTAGLARGTYELRFTAGASPAVLSVAFAVR